MRLLTCAVFGMALTACKDESPTQPSATEELGQPSPDLAANANQWITRADMPSGARRDLATAVVTNAAGNSTLYAIGGRTLTGGSLSGSDVQYRDQHLVLEGFLAGTVVLDQRSRGYRRQNLHFRGG